jgi:cell division protein FtsB
MSMDFVFGFLLGIIVFSVVDVIVDHKRRKEIIKILDEIKEANDQIKKHIDNIREGAKS